MRRAVQYRPHADRTGHHDYYTAKFFCGNRLETAERRRVRLARISHRLRGLSLALCPHENFFSLGNTHAYSARSENSLCEQMADRTHPRIGEISGLAHRVSADAIGKIRFHIFRNPVRLRPLLHFCAPPRGTSLRLAAARQDDNAEAGGERKPSSRPTVTNGVVCQLAGSRDQSMNIAAGCSSISLTSWIIAAAS